MRSHPPIRDYVTPRTAEGLAKRDIMRCLERYVAREIYHPINPTPPGAAGVRNARLHDAHRTAASLLLQQGVPARVAMQVLGHSQISLTLGTYSHVVPELAQEAADRMGDALWG